MSNTPNTSDLPDLSPNSNNPPINNLESNSSNPNTSDAEIPTPSGIQNSIENKDIPTNLAPKILSDQVVSNKDSQPQGFNKNPADLKVQSVQIKPKLPKKILLVSSGLMLFIILSGAVVLGFSKFVGPTNLHYIPDNAEFYLGISVRDHPQVKQLKELTQRFPGGEEISKEPLSFSRELFGTQKDPFEDIVRLAKKEIFLAKVSPTSSNGNGLDKLLNIVELESPSEADEKLNNFKEDKSIYSTNTLSFDDEEILKIKLIKQGKPSDRIDLGGVPLGITIPYSQSVYASAVDKFILSAEKLTDLKKSLSLKDSANPFNFKNKNDLNNILSDNDHKKISKFFPKDYLVKFYQQKPLEPFSNLLPVSSITQSFMFGFDSLSRVEGKNFIEVNRGLIISANDQGLKMNTYQLDWRTPNKGLINPYKISESLANNLPEKYSGVSPSIFAETNNLKQLISDQEELLAKVAEKSDNRDQRKQFQEAVDGIKEFKKMFQQSLGIDPEKDILSHIDKKSAFIFNSGSGTVSPEILLVAQIDDKTAVENIIKKLQIPNYFDQYQKKSTNFTRSKYKNFTIHSIKIYEYEKISFYINYAVTNDMVIISSGTGIKSIKDIIDFDKNKSKSLATRQSWKDQFEKISNPIGGLIYIEPIQFFGLYEYYKKQFPEVTTYVDAKQLKDMEIVAKGYLETLNSIGTTISKESPVYITTTFIKIKELPSSNKITADEAFSRLRNQYNKSSNGPVLGSFDFKFDLEEKARDIRKLIFN